MLVGVLFGIMECRVSVGILPVNDTPHLLLNEQIVVAQQCMNRLDVDITTLITVNHNFVIITSLQNHMQNRLLKLVLQQKISVIEVFEHFHHFVVASRGG